MVLNCILCRVGLKKDVLPVVVLVSDKTSVHQLRSRKKRERNLVGVKPLVSKKRLLLGVPALERGDNNTYIHSRIGENYTF